VPAEQGAKIGHGTGAPARTDQRAVEALARRVRRLLLRVAVVLLGEVVVGTAAGGRMAGMAGADAAGVVGGLRLLLLEQLVLVLLGYSVCGRSLMTRVVARRVVAELAVATQQLLELLLEVRDASHVRRRRVRRGGGRGRGGGHTVVHGHARVGGAGRAAGDGVGAQGLQPAAELKRRSTNGGGPGGACEGGRRSRIRKSTSRRLRP
jgi:hypothetical protein